MGTESGGIIEQHRTAILDAVLAYHGRLAEASLGVNAGEIPARPFPSLWALYNQMERFGALPEDGGLHDQFYLQMVELTALDEALQIIKRQNQPPSSPP